MSAVLHRSHRITGSHISLQVLLLRCSLQRNVLHMLQNGQPLYSLFRRKLRRRDVHIRHRSTIILRPVKPASPCGPPITKRPVGLMKNLVSASIISFGRIGSKTYFLMSAWICSCVTSSSCCVDNTTASRRTGFPASSYSTETCVFPSGLK